jgi:plastocyanin
VKKLKATTYRFKIMDKSSGHNFRLKGPGYNKAITRVGFTGTKTVTVRLEKGTYRYVCDPHSSEMKGSFKVG